jgi:hypothetical protein
LSSDGDSGLSAPITVDGNKIIDKIIVESSVLHKLDLHGVLIKKSIIIRAAIIYLLENLYLLQDNPLLLQRVFSNTFFTYTLSQIELKISKISTTSELEIKPSDRIISLSTQIHKESHELINEIITKSKIIQELEKLGYPIAKGTIIKAATAYILENLDIFEKRPEIIYRVLSLSGTHHILEKVHSLVLGGSKK